MIIEKKLRRQSVKILVEKALNCVGCGTCVSFCDSLSNIEDNLIVDPEKCNSCKNCINTRLMRGACIVRNFSPYRIEVETCRDLSFENDFDEVFPLNQNSPVGLIRTRMSLEKIIDKIQSFGEIKKHSQYTSIKNGKFIATVYKAKGYSEIKIHPRNNELEKAMNYIRTIIT